MATLFMTDDVRQKLRAGIQRALAMVIPFPCAFEVTGPEWTAPPGNRRGHALRFDVRPLETLVVADPRQPPSELRFVEDAGIVGILVNLGPGDADGLVVSKSINCPEMIMECLQALQDLERDGQPNTLIDLVRRAMSTIDEYKAAVHKRDRAIKKLIDDDEDGDDGYPDHEFTSVGHDVSGAELVSVGPVCDEPDDEDDDG